MPRLAYMVTKQTMCLKQTQSLLYFLLSRDENLSNID